MTRTLRTLTAALLFALASLPAPAAKAQGDDEARVFTSVEIVGWDFSYYDDKVREAVTRTIEPDANAGDSRKAAAALAERGNFFYGAGLPPFYKYALGDFRHALRFRPGDNGSKAKAKELTTIYETLGLPVPQNGVAGPGVASPVELFETTPVRMAFTPEKTYTHGQSLPGHAAFLYEFDAPAGQALSIVVRPEAGKSVAVFDLYFMERRGRRHAYVMGSDAAEFTLPVGGKHQIRVYSNSKTAGTEYELKVALK